MRAGGTDGRDGRGTFPGTRSDLSSCEVQDSVMKSVYAYLVYLGECLKVVINDVFDKPDCSSATIGHHTAALYLDKPGATTSGRVQAIPGTIRISRDIPYTLR